MICFPIMHWQTKRKIINAAYKADTKYGIMAELLFEFGYRGCDVIWFQKKHISNKYNLTFYTKEQKTGIRRLFEDKEIPESIKKYIADLSRNDYLFPSDKKYYKGKNNHLTLRHVRRVFFKIFSSIPKLQGAYGMHIFRKTFAYDVYKKKGDIYSVQLALGHKHISSTVKYLPKEVVMCEK